MARALASDEEDGARDGDLQACEPRVRSHACQGLGPTQRRGRQPAEIAAAASDSGDRALDVDVHDEVAADDVQPLHDQTETEVGSAARVAADRAQPQVVRSDPKGRHYSGQDGSNRILGTSGIVQPDNIDACEIADDVARKAVGRAVDHQRVGQRRQRSRNVVERLPRDGTLLERVAAGREGRREEQRAEDSLEDGPYRADDRDCHDVRSRPVWCDAQSRVTRDGRSGGDGGCSDEFRDVEAGREGISFVREQGIHFRAVAGLQYLHDRRN